MGMNIHQVYLVGPSLPPSVNISNLQQAKYKKKKQYLKSEMLSKIYTDLEDAVQYSNSDKLEYDYQITPDHKIRSQNIVLLSALCLHLFGSIAREKRQYDQIENRALTVGVANRQKSASFMSQACSRLLQWMKHDYEAEVLLDFLTEDRHSPGLFILRLESDSDFDTTNPLQREGHYAIIYPFSEEVQACIDTFVIKTTPISGLLLKRKLQFLNLISTDSNQMHSSQLNASGGYGFAKQGEVKCKLVEHSQEPQPAKNSVLIESSNIQGFSLNSTIVIKFEYFVIYGIKSGVERFQIRLEQQLNQINYRVYNRGDELFNNIMFTLRRNLAQRYHRCHFYSVNNGDFVEVYYHRSVEDIFNGSFLNANDYQTMSVTAPVRAVLRDPTMAQMKQNSPDMIVYEDGEGYEMLMAKKQVIQFIEFCKQDRKLQIESASKKENEGELLPKPKVDFSSNIELYESTVGRIFEMSDAYKMQQLINFKIDIGEHIRITNRVKKCDYVYLIFQDFAQLMQLQAIIEDPIDHKEIEKVIKQYELQIIHKPKEIVSISKNMTIRLYPCTEEIESNKLKYFNDIVQKLKEQLSFYIKTIVCSYQTLKLMLSVVKINFNINFAINQQFPLLECDKIFNQQTLAARIKAGKAHYEYSCMVKTDIINKDYHEPSNLNKDENALKEILKRNIHEYEIGDYMLNEVDQYNISYMIAENLQKMYFILSKKPTQQFVYLTFHQKLLKILRDKKGNFQRLEGAVMRDISRPNEAVIRPTIQRAFLTGQKYIAINLPFEHIKLAKLEDITRLPYGNHNLVRYYLGKLTESERYKLQIKPPCTTEYFEKVFAKQYVLRFDDKKLRSQIKQLDLGYGNIEKWREKPFVCMKADHYICQKVLRKFLLQYEPQQKPKPKQ